MDAKQVRQMQETVEEWLKGLNVETAWLDGVEEQIGDTLRAMLPVTDAGDCVLFELMATPFEGTTELLHLYTTLILEIGPGYEALKEIMLDWNLNCPLGAFGIYRPARQFYHRYTFPYPTDVKVESLAEQTVYLIKQVYTAVAEHFEDAVRLSGHN